MGDDLAESYEALGLKPGATRDDLRRAFVNRNFTLIRQGTEEDRQKLRAAHDRIAAFLDAEEKATRAPFVPVPLPAAPVEPESPPPRPAVAETPVLAPRTMARRSLGLTAFDSWRVNVFVPPLLFAAMWGINESPFGIFMRGFHVWMHEFGHATAAWLTGRKALPLPFGWTSIEPEYSHFVFIGVLALLVGLFVAGWRERKVWPMLAALVLASLQVYMTWRLPLERQEFWWTFCGVGGEFYLSALFMAFFFVELPEKFRWGVCRYIFFCLGATCFIRVYLHWSLVYHGAEEIPMGTLTGGVDDTNGDMNTLMSAYGWTHGQIRRTYYALANACVLGLFLVYAAFALRLNRVADWAVARLGRGEESSAGS